MTNEYSAEEVTAAQAVIKSYLEGSLVDGRPVSQRQLRAARRVVNGHLVARERAVTDRAREMGYKGAADMNRAITAAAKLES